MSDENAQQRTLLPFLQQLDVEGRLHDIAPEHERPRLFEPDVQLPGQTWLEVDDDAVDWAQRPQDQARSAGRFLGHARCGAARPRQSRTVPYGVSVRCLSRESLSRGSSMLTPFLGHSAGGV